VQRKFIEDKQRQYGGGGAGGGERKHSGVKRPIAATDGTLTE
jgi:hypothetical protein